MADLIPRAGRLLKKDCGDAQTVFAAILQAQEMTGGTDCAGYAYKILKGDGPGDNWLMAAKLAMQEGDA